MARFGALGIAGCLGVLAIVGAAAWAVVGNAGSGASPTPTSTAFPPWPSSTATYALVPVELVARSGSEITVTLPDSEKVTFDLHKVGVYDCRTDCWTDITPQLPPIAPTDRLCVYTTSGSPPQVWKLWVNRVAACHLTEP
jgi:hypothetical protein